MSDEESAIILRFRLKPGVEYVEDIEYEVTDVEGRPLAGHWTDTWQSQSKPRFRRFGSRLWVRIRGKWRCFT